jgi:hypothetical protein
MSWDTSLEQLSCISYDLTNANGLVTNEPVFITDQNFSTNTWESTTNVFQGFDVPLTNGLNVITLHAMDLAGNMTTLATNIICTGNTNPPVVALLWPQDGMQISGDSFTIQGQVDDPTASVLVTAVDASGNTNVINGRTGRDGVFWIENVPLSAGTTTLALTLSNAAGDTTTNFSVSQSNVGLSVDAVQAGDTTVNVSIDTDGYTVWVNGVEATDNGDGTWTAQITPICIGGGLVQVTAVPNGGGGYGMANNRSQSMENNSQNQNVNTQAAVQPPQGVYLVSSTGQFREDYSGDEYMEGSSSWADDAGGWMEEDSFDGLQTWDDSITWPTSPWPEAVPWGILWVTNNGQFSYYTHRPASLSFNYANAKVKATDPVTGSSFSASAQGAFEFATGGPLGSTAVRLYQFIGSVTVHHNPTPDLDEVPWSTWPDDETVTDGRVSLENVGNLDANGKVLVQLADNTRVMVTPSVKGQDDYSTPPPTPVEVTLTGLTVVSNSATQIAATNWACVKTATDDWVYIKATLSDMSDTNAANQIVWGSTGNPLLPVAGDPFQRRLTKTNSVKSIVTATVGSTSSNLCVWVIWANLTLKMSSSDTLSPDDGANLVGFGYWLPAMGGGQNLGAIDWYGVPGLTYACAIGKIEAKAKLYPSGIGGLIASGWHVKRFAQMVAWDNGVYNSGSDTNNYTYNDSGYLSNPDACDEDPNSGGSVDTIYNVDAPGCPLTYGFGVNHTCEVYENFNDYVSVPLGGTDQQCSDTKPWSYTAQVDVDGSKADANTLAPSHITLPPSPHYSTRSR